MNQDTIYAPSTATGGAIAIIRISGGDAKAAVRLLSADVTRFPHRLCRVDAVAQGEVIDECMAVFFPAPNSYTGEDMLEIHCHGGVQTVRRLLGMLSALGLRPAAGGEFTRRAFLNGKMDLAQAEAVMDVINATAEQSRKAAMFQMQGGVSRAVRAAETLLTDALAGLEVAIDFPDEAEADVNAALPALLSEATERIARLIDDGRRGRVLRDGLRVAILGRPNVGKSSLMNALLGRERAIVTADAGTTRDVLDEGVSFDGVPVRLIDTAGLRAAADEAERIGVARAREAMLSADVICTVLDASDALSPEDEALLAETARDTRIIVLNKSDLPQKLALDADALCVSAKTGAGLSALKERILALAAPAATDGAMITNERHIHALERAQGALQAAAEAADADCKATDIRQALHQLGQITGADADADVLERIFARFCVGK